MNLQKFLNQDAVYWGSPTPNGFGGYTYGDPVDVKVRWSIKQEKFLSAHGADNSIEEILSAAVILSETDFEINGRLWLGKVVDLSSDELPDTNGANTIKGFEKIPTMKADQFLRKAWLV